MRCCFGVTSAHVHRIRSALSICTLVTHRHLDASTPSSCLATSLLKLNNDIINSKTIYLQFKKTTLGQCQ